VLRCSSSYPIAGSEERVGSGLDPQQQANADGSDPLNVCARNAPEHVMQQNVYPRQFLTRSSRQLWQEATVEQ
jgi:hypothetical protein